jgi:hypothetical protein
MRTVKVSWLPPREREIAEIVYAEGEASRRKSAVPCPIPLPTRRSVRCCPGFAPRACCAGARKAIAIITAPAVSDQAAREAALRKVSRDYFDGSLLDTAAVLIEMARTQSGDRARMERGHLSVDP